MMHGSVVGMLQLCLIGDGAMAAVLSEALGAMPAALESAQEGLASFRSTIAQMVEGNATVALAEARTQMDVLINGDSGDPIMGAKGASVFLDADGNAYPTVCSTDPYDPLAEPVCEPATCSSLRCIDNTFDLIDRGEVYNAEGASTGHSRTTVFTYLNSVASLGATMAIAGLLLGEPKYWRLCAMLFFLWGPLSLVVCAPIYPLFMVLSDTCQDVEDLAIQFTVASSAEFQPGAASMVVMNGKSEWSILSAFRMSITRYLYRVRHKSHRNNQSNARPRKLKHDRG
jgi:hypothetical protein